jgi:hypothetical protein
MLSTKDALTSLMASSSPARTKSLIQGRELAVPITRPPTLLQLIFDAANVCTILAMLFDLFAIAVTLRDKNIHLAIALGQMSAMCVHHPAAPVCART